LTNYRKKLKQDTFRQYQENRVQERRDWEILARGKEAAKDNCKTDFIQSIWLLIPERGLARAENGHPNIPCSSQTRCGMPFRTSITSVFKTSPSTISRNRAPSMALPLQNAFLKDKN
jgi:hypothetical protein